MERFALALSLLAAAGCSNSQGGGTGGAGGAGTGGGAPADAGAPDLFIDIDGSGEPAMTGACAIQTPLMFGQSLLPGPAAEVMVGELGAFVISACRTTGKANPSVVIKPDNNFLVGPGTVPAKVWLTDAAGVQREGTAMLTIDQSVLGCGPSGTLPDGGPPAILTGKYTSSPLTPVVAMDAGPSDAGVAAAISGAFRVDLVCEDGGS